jgi:thiol-disulfide isomerase/thioredoxin
MNKLILTLTVVISFQFYSCKANTQQIKETQNERILIIIKPKDTYKFDTINLPGKEKLYNPSPEIIYTEYRQSTTSIIAPNKNKSDSIIITPKSDYILLEFNYYGYYKKFCLLSKGDSVIIDYFKGKPYFKFLNNKIFPLDNYFDDKFNNIEPLPITIAFFKYFSIWDKPKKEEFLKTSAEYYTNLNICLDSLYFNKLISHEFYLLRKNFNNYLLTNYEGKPSFDFSALSKDAQDSLMLYNFFRFALQDFANKKLSKAKLIKTSSGSTIDSRVVYDSVRNSNTLSLTAKKHLLFSNIQLIAQNFSRKDFSNYFLKFEKDINDTDLVSNIKDKYLFDLASQNEESRNLNMLNLYKNKITLNEIFKKNKGKLIYIDFWASWCKPCRNAMPASVILKRDYQDRDVVFIYISIDKDFDSWKIASQKEELTNYPNSFLAVNTDVAELLKEIKLTTIPRYLLFDKMGNLIHKNAPGPESQEIRSLLNEFVNKSHF